MLLIFPPQWTPISPHFAIPSLLGQLLANGYCAEGIDLNTEFYDYILTPDFIKNSIRQALIQFEDMHNNLLSVYNPNKNTNDYTLEEHIFLYRYNKMKVYIEKNSKFVHKILSNIQKAKNNIRSEHFYNPETFITSLYIIDKALEVASLPYTPTKIEFESVQNPFFKLNLESIKYFVFDKTSNIFSDFYKNRIEEIINKEYDFIGISLNSSSQIIAGLTLSYMLKQRTKAHINIGGNFFGRIANELARHKDFFELFADSVSVEEGEGPIIEVAKYVNNEIKIEDVPNLMYLKDGVVRCNDNMEPLKLNDISNMDLKGYDLKKYFSPVVVMPYQSSRGCYWGKCSFCDQDFGQRFNVKNPQKIISEFKEFKDKYNIQNFEFIDESVSPVSLKAISENVINNGLNINFFIDARLETDFTPEILKRGSEAGLKMILWGLESGSKSVLELINKGIDIDRRFEIMADTKKAGIWNFAFIFFGFPTETVDDAILTVRMLVDNNNVIDSYGRSVYTMGRHSKLAEAPEKYGITKIYPAEEEFSPNINFDCIGMTQQELKHVQNYCLKECFNAYKNPLWMYLRTREYLFLYIAKYGVDYVRNYKVNINKEV